MADQIDNSINVTINISPEGVASISCTNCTGTVITGGDYTVNYRLTNNSATEDLLFAELWSGPGPDFTGDTKELDLYRNYVPGNGYVDLSVIFQDVASDIHKSIRVGHSTGELGLEDFSPAGGYTIINPSGYTIFAYDPANHNRLLVTGLPRGVAGVPDAYVRKQMTLPLEFTLYYKLTITQLDINTSGGNPVAQGVGATLPMLFTRNPATRDHAHILANKDGCAWYIRPWNNDVAVPYMDLISRSYLMPTTCSSAANGKKACLPTSSPQIGHEWTCNGTNWVENATVTCQDHFSEASGLIDTQTYIPRNGTPRWIKIIRRVQTNNAYYGSIFDIHVYSDENYQNELSPSGSGCTGSLHSCFLPDLDPLNYFLPCCISNTDTNQFLASAVIENMFFTYP
jgi:hypothetical protein